MIYIVEDDSAIRELEQYALHIKIFLNMENIMEKEPTLIEQKFEDAVKNFRQEMEKGKESMQYVLCKL